MGINELSDLPELKEVAPLLEERERFPEGADELAGVGAGEVEPAKSEAEVTAADGAT